MPTEKPRDDEERAEQPTPAEPPPQPPVPIREFGGQSGEETEDERLLQRDSQRTGPETTTDAWRVFRIMGEFVEGFDTLARLGPSVSIFGSARTRPDDPDYHAAQRTAELLVEHGFGVITGGGPGISTYMPALYVIQSINAREVAQGMAAATMMLLPIVLVIIVQQVFQWRAHRKAARAK